MLVSGCWSPPAGRWATRNRQPATRIAGKRYGMPRPWVLAMAGAWLGGCLVGWGQASHALSLDDALTCAVEHSAELKIARLEIERMVHRLRRVRVKYYPGFTIEGSAPDYRDITQTGRSPESFTAQDLSYSLTLREHLPGNMELTAQATRTMNNLAKRVERLQLEFSKELIHRDPVARQMALAKAKVSLEEESFAQIQREFTYRVHVAYYGFLQARHMFKNNQARFKSDQRLDEESRRKYKAGIIARYHLLDYQRDYSRSEIGRLRKETAFQHARNELSLLLHEDATVKLGFRDVKDAVFKEAEWDAKAMLVAAMSNSLAVAQIQYALFANEENVRYLKNRLWPSLTVRAGAQWDGSDNVYNDVQSETTAYCAGLNLVMPLFADRAGTRLDIAVEQAGEAIGRLELTELFRRLKMGIRNDLLDLRELYRRYQLARTIEKISSEDYDLSKKRFDAGAIRSWDMIRSKNAHYDGRDQAVGAKYAVLRKMARMERDYPVR